MSAKHMAAASVAKKKSLRKEMNQIIMMNRKTIEWKEVVKYFLPFRMHAKWSAVFKQWEDVRRKSKCTRQKRLAVDFSTSDTSL